MTKRKLPTMMAFLGLIFLLQLQGFAQDARQSSQTSEKKQMTRAQFADLSDDKQRDLIHDFNLIEITDVVNATAEEAKSSQQNVFYYSIEQYNNASKEKQFELIRHPEMYRIYDSNITGSKNVVEGVVKSTTLTKSQLKSLPEDKQKAVLQSSEFTIID